MTERLDQNKLKQAQAALARKQDKEANATTRRLIAFGTIFAILYPLFAIYCYNQKPNPQLILFLLLPEIVFITWILFGWHELCQQRKKNQP